MWGNRLVQVDSHLFLQPGIEQTSRSPHGTGSGNERTSNLEQEDIKWSLLDKKDSD
jgi:hypothetical protein